MKRIIVCTLILSGFCGLRCEATVFYSNGSAANVQLIHNTQAVNGDTITLPAGTFTWNTQVQLIKNITIQGAGQNATYINDNVPKQGGGPTTIMMNCTGITGDFRVTGFTVRGMAQDLQGYNKGTIDVSGSSHSVRIDHLTFDYPGTSAIHMTGSVWGVVDHCYFNEPNSQMGVLIFHDNWGGVDLGDGGFDDPTHLGSGEGVYIEDCTFIGNGLGGNGATDASYSGRFVFRHNILIRQNLGTHGTEVGPYRGVRSYEIYNNQFISDTAVMDKGIYLRGGTGVIWGNTFSGACCGSISGYKDAISCDNFRSFNNFEIWGMANGQNPWDENTDQYGHATIDQVGRGVCLDHIRGSPPINQRTGNAAWPRQQAEPVYVWSNNWTPVPNNPGYYISSNQNVVQIGRDIINNGNTPMPGYTPYGYPHPLVSGSFKAVITDVNRDGSPDFLLQRNGRGETAIWYLNNNVLIDGDGGPTLPNGWSVRDTADFDGDGHPDYALFHPAAKLTAIFYMSGPTVIGGAWGPTFPAGWELVGVSDFNGDGKPDYLLYKALTRQTAIWYLNNNVLIGGDFAPSLPNHWSLVGIADFNRDGHPDYALSNTASGESAIWYLSGPTFIGSAWGPTVSEGWGLVGTADFDGDANPDFLLYNGGSHETAVWYLNNNVFVSSAAGPTLPAAWGWPAL